MTKASRFQLCLEQAKRIVGAYRQEAPKGFDPTNTWVAIGVGVAGIAVSAGTSMYQQSQQKKAAAAAAANGGGGGGGSIPSYIPANFSDINQGAVVGDMQAYARSDKNFAQRHPTLLAGEGQFEKNAAQDQVGNTSFIPQMQSEAINSGLGSALDAFGDNTGTLKMGGAGEADVAKNLGISVLGFQQQNRQNAQQSLSLAEQLFPRRQIGLSGQDFAQMEIGNVNNENAFNSANYAASLGAAGRAQTSANTLAAAQAQASGAQAQMYGSLASSALQAGGQAYGSYQANHPAGSGFGGNTSPTGPAGSATFNSRPVPTATAITSG